MMCCSHQGLQGCVPVAIRSASRSVASRNRRARASRWLASAAANVAPLSQRISISEEISSPATLRASTSSACAASSSSSKRCTSERDSRSRIPNSSSMPTVKSVEASKTSLARRMSSMAASYVR